MKIQFNNISKSYDGITIFENISGKINEGDKVGLIGENGIGKTTLLRILCNKEERDAGSVLYSPERTILTYFEQNQQFDCNRTVYEEIYSGLLFEEPSADKLSIQTKAKSLLFKIGIRERDFDKKLSQLSGGEKTKLFLSKALSQKTDVLILDEPTNHLDINTVKWLENFIRKLSITVLIVSHDRQFLDNTVNKIFQMSKDKLKEYIGNYTDFKHQRELEIITLKRQYEKETREVSHLRKVIDQRTEWFAKTTQKAGGGIDYRCWKDKSGNQARIVKSKQIMLAKLEANRIEKPKEETVDIFDIVNRRFIDRHLPKYLIEVKNLTKHFNDAPLFENASFTIRTGEKLALLGDNGSGKTTLLKLLLGIEKPTSGEIYINPSLKIGYFSQELEQLNADNTLISEFMLQGVSQQHARAMLSALLFNSEDINKKTGVLSMGEKCRAALGKLILSETDVLFLDEPTNFMDILSRESFENAVAQYRGTIILVSHDRYFINNFAERILLLEDKRLKIYNGGYDYFVQKRIREKKESSIGISYNKAADDIILLECRLASISMKLGDKTINEEQRGLATKEFFELSAKLRELKKQIK